MNLNLIKTKNETEDLLQSITKKCETLFEQTRKKSEETMEFKMFKPRDTFLFNPPIQLKEDSMIGLTNLEVYNSVLNITEENNKFELFVFPDSKIRGISYEKVRDEIEKDFDVSDFTDTDLQDEKIGPIILKEYREQVTKRMEDGGYMNFLSGYLSSVFQDFESYLRTEVDLFEDDIRLLLKKYKSSFITYESDPGFYTFKDLPESVFNILQPEYPGPSNVIDIEFHDISRKNI